MIGLNTYLVLSAILFFMGFFGVLVRKNLLMLLFCTEIMLNAVNLGFVAISKFHAALDGQIFAFFIIAIAASEVAVGLGLLIILYRRFKSIDLDKIAKMFG